MSETRPNEHRAYLTFVGDFDPERISSALDLRPTRCWRKGDINPKTELERKFSRWCLDSRLEQSASLEEHLQDVLEQLAPHAQKVAHLRASTDGVMQLVGYFHTSYPGFGLDEQVVSFLAALRLGIDCDFYYLYSDRREDSE